VNATTRAGAAGVDAERPRRPVSVELAAALLVVGSATDAVISLESMATAATPDARGIAAVSVVVGLGLVVLGLLVRSGRAWLVAVNVVAIAAFLELRAVSPAGLISAAIDVIVVAILFRERWWFRWTPPPAADSAPGER